MVNLLARQEIVKEFINAQLTPQNLHNYTMSILSHPQTYRTVQQGLKQVRASLKHAHPYRAITEALLQAYQST